MHSLGGEAEGGGARGAGRPRPDRRAGHHVRASQLGSPVEARGPPRGPLRLQPGVGTAGAVPPPCAQFSRQVSPSYWIDPAIGGRRVGARGVVDAG